MKLNKKGITIVEMLVSIALISVVLIFLLRLLLALEDMDDKSLSMLEYEEKTSVIISEVQNYIKDLNDCNFTKNNNTKLTIACPNVESNNYITMQKDNKNLTITNCFNLNDGDCEEKTWQFPTNSTLSDIKLTSKNNLLIATIDVTDDKDNIYPIEISYYKTNS